MLAWRGGVPAGHPQPAPCIRPARLCLSSPPRSSGLPQPPLPAAHTYSRLNVPLGFLPGSSAPPCSLSWVCLSVCQVPKWIWDLQDQQERNVKLKWSPGWGCWPQSRVAGSPRCGWDTCRASLWHLSTAGNTDHKGENHSVVDALVSLGPVSGEFRGPKHPPAPEKAPCLTAAAVSVLGHAALRLCLVPGSPLASGPSLHTFAFSLPLRQPSSSPQG